MATNPFFSGRIPQTLFDHVEKFREESGEEKTELLIKALAQYTNFELEEKPFDIPPIRKEFNTIYTQLENAFSKIKYLEKLVNVDKKATTNNNSINQLELLESDKSDPILDNLLITNDNKTKIFILSSTETVKKTGISQPTLSVWKKKNQFPRTYTDKKTNKTFEIDLEKNELKKNLWRVRLIDNY